MFWIVFFWRLEMCLLVNLFILSKEDYTYLGIILYYIFVLLDHVFYVNLVYLQHMFWFRFSILL